MSILHDLDLARMNEHQMSTHDIHRDYKPKVPQCDQEQHKLDLSRHASGGMT